MFDTCEAQLLCHSVGMNSSFTVMNDKEKLQMLTYKKLGPENVGQFCLLISSQFVTVITARSQSYLKLIFFKSVSLKAALLLQTFKVNSSSLSSN